LQDLHSISVNAAWGYSTGGILYLSSIAVVISALLGQ
jgi:hypothetical protein